MVHNWYFFKNLSLPPVGTPSQVGWPAENQKPKHPSWSYPPSTPPLLFPGPMEGQAVPTEPCQGCALTPTIHSNPPPLHPFPLFPPQPWHSACQPQSCLLLALPRPPSLLSPSRAGGWPEPSRAQSPGQAPAAQMQSQGLKLRAWPSLFSPWSLFHTLALCSATCC